MVTHTTYNNEQRTACYPQPTSVTAPQMTAAPMRQGAGRGAAARAVNPPGHRNTMRPFFPIDLHLHSTVSDGRLRPAALVARAAERGVRAMALTDHDTVAGMPEAAAEAQRRGIELLSGVELSVTWGKRTLHVVGLGFDVSCPALEALLAHQDGRRRRRAERIARHLDRAGIPGALDGATAEAGGGVPGRAHFARFLVASGVVARPEEAFRRYLGRGRCAAVASEWVGLETGVRVLTEAGGVAVLAHPLRYGFTRTKCREAVDAVRRAGGHGLEVVCGSDGPGDRSSAAAMARRTGLRASVGSDFHDPAFPWRDVGRLHNPPADLPPIWSHWPALTAIAAEWAGDGPP